MHAIPNDLLFPLFNEKPHISEYHPLVLAACLYRLKNLETDFELDDFFIQDPSVAENVSKQDIALAEEIKTHYLTRFSNMMLQEKPLTLYRREVLLLLKNSDMHESRGVTWTTTDAKKMYALPYKYFEDKALEQNVYRFCRPNYMAPNKLKASIEGTMDLTFLHKISKKYTNQYWFRNESGDPLLLPCDKASPFSAYFESIISSSNIQVEGVFRLSYRNGESHYYYSAARWSFISHFTDNKSNILPITNTGE